MSDPLLAPDTPAPDEPWRHDGELHVDADRVAVAREVLGLDARISTMAAPAILLDAGNPFYGDVEYPFRRDDLGGFTTVGDEYRLERPLRVGEWLRTRTVLADVTERVRGDGSTLVLVRYEQTCHGAEGTAVGEHTWTVAFFDQPPGDGGLDEKPTGTPLAEASLDVDVSILRRWSDAIGDHHPIHLDADYARACGLADVVAHASLECGLLLVALERATGAEQWLESVAVRYHRGVSPGSTLVARAHAPPDGEDAPLPVVATVAGHVVATGTGIAGG